ncbi:MAG: hypothetical protein RLZ86_194 [Actinomycetota bacterium]|jgi:hypothetical protein
MALALDPRYVIEVRTSARPRPDMATIYRRRRLVVAALALILTVAASAGIRSLASRGDGAAPVSAVTPGSPTAGQISGVDVSGAYVISEGVYVVQPGDTMWSIASSLTSGSIRGYVADLVALNGGASLDVGQILVLP